MIKLYLLETNVHKIDVIRSMKYFCFIAFISTLIESLSLVLVNLVVPVLN